MYALLQMLAKTLSIRIKKGFLKQKYPCCLAARALHIFGPFKLRGKDLC